MNTQGENIADNGGIKQAFNAYKAYEEKHGPGQRLPGLETFNSKKLFFMAFGQVSFSHKLESVKMIGRK